MPVDFQQAFFYPFKRKHRQSCLGLPTLAFLLVLGLLLLINLGLNDSDYSFWLSVIDGLQLLATGAFVLLGGGFLWNLQGRWKQQGLSVDPPSWKGNVLHFATDGLKLWVYLLSWMLPLGMITLVSQLAIPLFSLPAFSLCLLAAWCFIVPLFTFSIPSGANRRRLKRVFFSLRTLLPGSHRFLNHLVKSCYGALFLMVLLLVYGGVLASFLVLISTVRDELTQALLLFLFGILFDVVLFCLSISYSHVLTQLALSHDVQWRWRLQFEMAKRVPLALSRGWAISRHQ